MLECVAQLLELFVLKYRTKVHGGFFIVPSAILLYSIFLMFWCNLPLDLNNFASSLSTMVALKIELKIGGLCFLAFVISELVISIAFFKPLYHPKQFAEEKKQAEAAAAALEEERRKAAIAKAEEEKLKADAPKEAQPAVDHEAKI